MLISFALVGLCDGLYIIMIYISPLMSSVCFPYLVVSVD